MKLYSCMSLLVKGKKVKVVYFAVSGIPSHSYRVSLAIRDHTVLPATRYKWTYPALTPARQAGTRFTYRGGMEGWVDLVDLIAPQPGVEPSTFRSRVRRWTAAPPICTQTYKLYTVAFHLLLGVYVRLTKWHFLTVCHIRFQSSIAGFFSAAVLTR